MQNGCRISAPECHLKLAYLLYNREVSIHGSQVIPYQSTCCSSSHPCMTYVRALRCPLNHLGLVSYSHVWLSNYIIWCRHYSCRLKDVESLAYVFDGDRLDWEHRLDAGLCQGESARRDTQPEGLSHQPGSIFEGWRIYHSWFH